MVIIFSLYFGLFELYQLIEDKRGYFSEVFNYCNSTQIVLNLLICVGFGYRVYMFTPHMLYLLMAVSSFFGFTNCFYWMRFFDTTSRYVRMIFAAIYKIKDFLMV